MLHVSDRNIKNVMNKCHNENGFVLPAVYSRYVFCAVTKDMINEILRIIAIRTVNAFEITKYFVEFLFQFKTAVCSILGSSFSVQVFHSFDYMDDWSYIESTTIVSDGCEEFVIHQPVTHSCIALKIESKNEYDENLLCNKIRQTQYDSQFSFSSKLHPKQVLNDHRNDPRPYKNHTTACLLNIYNTFVRISCMFCSGMVEKPSSYDECAFCLNGKMLRKN